MLELVPGDPAVLLVGPEATQDALEAKRIQLGLDRPMVERIGTWLIGALRGDLGDSLFLQQSVMKSIVERFPITISLAILSLIVAVMVGVPIGIIASIKQGGFLDWVMMTSALIVLSIPSFWLALNFIFFFSVNLRLFPVGGYVAFAESPSAFFRHMFLPCFSLGLGYAAMIARMTRSSMLEVLRADYVRTAKAKGLRQSIVILRHALRNALIPIVTVIGLAVGGLLSGSVVTETVYNMPGMGRLVVEGVQRRDYPVVKGGILVVTLTYLFVNLIVDFLYVWIDPRISYQSKR